MEQYKEILIKLEEDAAKIQFHLSQMISSESRSSAVIEREIDGYMCEVETLCVRSRILLDGYRQTDTVSDYGIPDKAVNKIAGGIEVTHDGWLHITLNTLLPNCKYKTSGYIGDTICRLMHSYENSRTLKRRSWGSLSIATAKIIMLLTTTTKAGR